jgi:hypothetical protein
MRAQRTNPAARLAVKLYSEKVIGQYMAHAAMSAM